MAYPVLCGEGTSLAPGNQAGQVVLSYCPTKLMVAESLTKLATSEVIGVLLAAMDSQLPALTAACRTPVTPGPANRGDIAGDGPSSHSSEGKHSHGSVA